MLESGAKRRLTLYKVILVDDAPLTRKELLERIDWSRIGFEVAGEAGDATAGYRAYHTYQPHVVILDIHLPGMNGLTMVEQIRELDSVVFFIIYTEETDFCYVQRAIELHVQAYLQKPSEVNLLEAELLNIAQVLKRKGRR